MVLYFYFRHNDPSKRSFKPMLLALLHQLVVQDEVILYHAWEHLKLPSQAKAEELLTTGLRSCGHSFVILDGLDECGDGQTRENQETEKVFHFFRVMTTTWADDQGGNGSLRLLFSGQRDGILEP